MVKLTWSPDSVVDIENISEFIANDSEQYAALVVNRIINVTESISLFPLSGRTVPETENETIREKFYKSYRVIYRIKSKDHVEILRIFHQAQKMNMEFND